MHIYIYCVYIYIYIYTQQYCLLLICHLCLDSNYKINIIDKILIT